MKIEYRNYFSNFVIPKEKAELLDEYLVCYVDEATGLPKRIYTVLEGRVDGIDYYLEPGENEAEIAKLYVEGVSVRERMEEVQGLVIERGRYYVKGELVSVGDVVRDMYGNTICIQPLDKATLKPLFKRTTKYFYNYDDYSEEWGYPRIIAAEYNEDGSLDDIRWSPTPGEEQNDECYDSGGFNVLQAQFTKDLSYYLTAHLLPVEKRH
ncbi:hypothetical protein AM493_17595 [Flavobacterium akiainvivens]|uniref:Uncharacterized protein n=1 Tax=Flavobacterium akiainvivens TaxID=1202724 RepID=A0A0M8MBG8_9FLAO|nr:hypothetical protein [Flavobacterium akiainvivens]KOS07653.1 hypothetical protein AM493_17595 [Flavobacterium akiainvivens]SFQ23595.1 hypothetical protein SAMN05444144_102100 [Flavobacterium akiainvivens]